METFEKMFNELQIDENHKIDAHHLRTNLRDAFLSVEHANEAAEHSPV